MEIAKIIHAYVEALAWPIVAVLAMYSYRGVICSLLPGAIVKLTISGVTVETTIRMVEQSVIESLRGEKLTREQWAWLRRLGDEGPQSISGADISVLRLLRDAGLLRTVEKGFLQNAKAVEITSLGKLVVDAYERKLLSRPE